MSNNQQQHITHQPSLMDFLLLVVLLSLTRQVDARCKHHLSCSECVSDSNCQWSLFSAVHTSSSRRMNSNECHARPTMFHGKTAKQFPVRPGGDDIPISWAKDIVECPPDVTKEQYESVRGLSVLDAASMLRPTETKERPNSVRIPIMVLRLAHYISTVTTPSHIAFTPYVFFERWCSSASVREYHFHHSRSNTVTSKHIT